MTEDLGRFRISNADRDEAVALLQRALDEGRLDLSEFDTRSHQVYEAKTHAELDLIFDDLPLSRPDSGTIEPARPRGASDSSEPQSKPQSKPERKQRRKGHFVPPSLHWLIWVGTIATTAWIVSNLSSGDPEWDNFWPAYPMSVLGAITIAWWLCDRFTRD
ncbi:DUF1707 SHOCT-like domain-containing protein [Glycomyces buryatensis]|uniref:DUF1707 domain-containing protein n=1 Tax=Glycomyces buryatensis TaxID=2570927 RepID=A0A4S8PW31_9ACTN|nr:DUF1707 domain-containing protein [Glycomyces buryatensis]THV35738.1 DUF1707 domain-containing protein [Glycomyces buryatensis]